MIARGCQHLKAGMWNTARTTSGSCRLVNPKVFPRTLTTQGLCMITHHWVSRCPSPRVHSFRTAQLSVQRVNSRLMRDHESNCSEFHSLAAAIHSCFHPDGVSVAMNSHCCPCGWVAPIRPVCVPGFSGTFPHSLSADPRGHHQNRGGAFGESTVSRA